MKKIHFDKKIVVTAAFFAAFTVVLGAFGAHLLKNMVDSEAVGTFETGVRYQMYHSLALLVLGFASSVPDKISKWVSRFFVLGMVLFSGSIYLLALKSVLPFSVSFLGPVTPLGGLLLILGWLWLAIGLLTIKGID